MRTLLLILLVTQLGFSQQNFLGLEHPGFPEYLAQNHVHTIVGSLVNMPASDVGSVYAHFYLESPYISKKYVHRKVKLDRDGRFVLDINNSQPLHEITFILVDERTNQEYVYLDFFLTEGVELNIDYNIVSSEPQVFTTYGIEINGADGKLNRYINGYRAYEPSIQRALESEVKNLDRSLVMDEQITKLEKNFAARKRLISEYDRGKVPSYQFILKDEVKSTFLSEILRKYRREEIPDNFWRDILKHKPISISNSTALFYRSLSTYVRNMVEPEIEDIMNYCTDLTEEKKVIIKDLMRLNYMQKLGKPFDEEEARKLGEKVEDNLSYEISYTRYKSAIEHFKKKIPRSKLDIIMVGFRYRDQELQDLIYADMAKEIETPWIKSYLLQNSISNKNLTADINKEVKSATRHSDAEIFWDPMAEFSFGAKLHKDDSNNGQDLLRKLQEKYQEKTVLVNLWARWDGPSLSNLSNLTDLISEKEKYIIVHLCTDSGADLKSWERSIIELKSAGHHYLVPDIAIQEIKSHFKLKSYPSYLVLKKDGSYVHDVFPSGVIEKSPKDFEKLISGR